MASGAGETSVVVGLIYLSSLSVW